MRNTFKSVKSLASIGTVCAAMFALSPTHAQPFEAHPSTQEESIKVIAGNTGWLGAGALKLGTLGA